MHDRISENMRGIFGTIATASGALTSWQTDIEWALRVGASAAAIVVAFYTVRSIIRKDRSANKEDKP